MEVLAPLDDYVGRAAYFVGDLDRKVSKVIERIVRPGDTVLDIGSNMGLITMPLAQLVTAQGVVHSFEPNPAIRELLAASLDRNRLQHVLLHSYALGAEEGQIQLSYPRGNAGRGTLCESTGRDNWNSVQVQVRTLSAVAREIDLQRVRLVKIDVEGFEHQVIGGAQRWLTDHPPDVFIFESNASSDADSTRTVLSQFSSLGYVLYAIPKTLFAVKLIPYQGGDGQSSSHDMIAISRDREREVVARF